MGSAVNGSASAAARRSQRRRRLHAVAQPASSSTWLTYASEWPSVRPEATTSRTRCFSSFNSGKRPSRARDHMTSPFRRISNIPPLPGSKSHSPRSAWEAPVRPTQPEEAIGIGCDTRSPSAVCAGCDSLSHPLARANDLAVVNYPMPFRDTPSSQTEHPGLRQHEQHPCGSKQRRVLLEVDEVVHLR